MSYALTIHLGGVSPAVGSDGRDLDDMVALLNISVTTPDGHVISQCIGLGVKDMVALTLETEQEEADRERQAFMDLLTERNADE